nr:hypothetical protein [Tanacetum cinerariifolium]
MQKNSFLIAKYFKKIYKPTNNNLKTSSNSKNKNVDTTLRYKNNDHSGQFGNQRKVNVAGAREKVGSPAKRVKDSACHMENMLLCKQAEQGVPLQAEHNTCVVETDDTNVTPDSPDMCEDNIQNDQNDVESDDEPNTTLAQELKECKAILAKTSKSLRESISIRDSWLVALQTKQTEFEKYKAFNDRTVDN